MNMVKHLSDVQRRLNPVLAHVFPARRRLWREALIILLIALAYILTRSFDTDRAEDAFEHARQILAFEQWAALNPEYAMQALAVQHPWLMDAANTLYLWAHIPALLLVAAWLYWLHPEGYAWYRTAFLFSAIIGLTIYVLVPVAPPRDMPGFIDTLKLTGMSIDSSAAGSIYNPYGAMPSLHVAWESLAGAALFRYARYWPLKIAGVALPCAMTLIVLMTGNHYLLDTIAGMAIAIIALLSSSAWFVWRRSWLAAPVVVPAISRATSLPLMPVPSRDRR